MEMPVGLKLGVKIQGVEINSGKKGENEEKSRVCMVAVGGNS